MNKCNKKTKSHRKQRQSRFFERHSFYFLEIPYVRRIQVTLNLLPRVHKKEFYRKYYTHIFIEKVNKNTSAFRHKHTNRHSTLRKWFSPCWCMKPEDMLRAYTYKQCTNKTALIYIDYSILVLFCKLTLLKGCLLANWSKKQIQVVRLNLWDENFGC